MLARQPGDLPARHRAGSDRGAYGSPRGARQRPQARRLDLLADAVLGRHYRHTSRLVAAGPSPRDRPFFRQCRTRSAERSMSSAVVCQPETEKRMAAVRSRSSRRATGSRRAARHRRRLRTSPCSVRIMPGPSKRTRAWLSTTSLRIETRARRPGARPRVGRTSSRTDQSARPDRPSDRSAARTANHGHDETIWGPGCTGRAQGRPSDVIGSPRAAAADGQPCRDRPCRSRRARSATCASVDHESAAAIRIRSRIEGTAAAQIPNALSMCTWRHAQRDRDQFVERAEGAGIHVAAWAHTMVGPSIEASPA